jgi:sporulation protein YlmC with PRC-barrel domain
VGYATLTVGTPVVTSDGATVGTVREVRYHEREQMLDGLIVESSDGIRFVDAPEVGDMTRRRVEIGLTRLDFLMLPWAR